MNGWISIDRQIQNHWIWQDPIKFKWWMDILLTVNIELKKVNLGYDVFDCNRGESIMSLQTWATRWKVSKDTARNFLKLLEKENMIKCVSVGKSTRLTVCNYDTYQMPLHVKQTQSKRNTHTTKQYNNKTNNNNVGLQATPTADEINFLKRCQNFVEYFNSQKNSKYQATEKVIKAYRRAIKKYSKDDFVNVIAAALNDSHHRQSNFMYVTPEFVLREEIIERYKNIKPINRQMNY